MANQVRIETARAARSEQACGRAVAQMVEGAWNYCLEFKGATDQEIGEDCVLGPEMQAVLSALRGLLNGPTGRIDCGEMDAKILSMARRHGLADENGEI